MKILSFILALAFITHSLSAQFENIRYTQLTQKEGLSDDLVTAILQDSKGFIWFGTYSKGLCRYDGNTFEVFKYDVQDSNSISSNFIYEIYEDSYGNLWVTTESGLNKLDYKQESFTHYNHLPLLDKEGDNWLIAMAPGKSDKLWLASWSSVILQFDIKTETYKRIRPVDGDQELQFNAHILRMYVDSHGMLWIGTFGQGLYVVDPSDDFKVVHHYSSDPKDKYRISNDSVMSIYEDRQGNIWIGTLNGLNILNFIGSMADQRTIEHFYSREDDPFSISHGAVYGIQEDDTGIIWIRTVNGINAYNRETGQFKLWPHDDVPVHSFERYYSLHTLMIDNVGAIWFTVFYQGASMFSYHGNKFDLVQQDSLKPNGIPSNAVSSFLLDSSGVLWVGTWWEGLMKRVPGEQGKGATWHLYAHDPNDPTSISGNDVRRIVRDSKGDLWIGTEGSGLNKLINEKNGEPQFKRYMPEPVDGESMGREDIVHEDKTGNLWIGGVALYLFDREREEYFHYVADTANIDSLPVRWISTMAEDSSGSIWVGSWGEGLFKISPPFIRKGNYVTGKTLSYKYHSDLPNDLGGYQIRSILVPTVHTESLLWIATQGGGLYCLKKKKDNTGNFVEYFKIYLPPQGLPSTRVQGIEEDANGDLWISTGNGLSKFNPSTELFINYYEGDGLPLNEFGWLAHYSAPDGKLYYGLDGLLSFYPDSISKNQFIPNVYITRLSLFGNPLKVSKDSPLKTTLSETKVITFTHDQNYLTIEYAALNYIMPEENRYKYMLEGFDADWVDAGTFQTAVYQGLQPGTYTFRVIGSNNDGIWNTEGATLKIIIRPPWWRTIPAIIFYILFLVIGGYSFMKFRERKLLRDKKKLEEKIFERTEELHEVNTQLEEHHEELEQQKEELQQTLNYLKETQAQLIQTEKLASIGQLTAGIAHEINNPVNYIHAGIDSLKTNIKEIGSILDLYRSITEENVGEKLKRIRVEEEKIDIEETRKEIRHLIKSITNGTERTTEIVKGLRTFSRLDENEIKPANIHEGIDLTLVMLHNKYKRHIKIVKQYGEVPLVDCFPGKLNQVFMNILSNAIEAIPEKGTVTIKTWENKPDNKVVISIKDDGAGMTETTKSNLFNPFFTTKEVGKGTGLGLSISHGIIEQHKGSIKVKSEPGKGAEFIISLPIKL